MRIATLLRHIIRIVFCAFIALTIRGSLFAQSDVRVQTGEVRVTIAKSFAAESNERPYEIFLIAKRKLLRLEYEGRDSEKKDASVVFGVETGDLKFTDNYRVRVPPGIYRVVIKRFARYRFANFRVYRGETTHLLIEEDDFAWDTICYGDILLLKTIDNIEPRTVQKQRYKSSPFRSVSTERILLKAPFDLVVRYCGKLAKGRKTVYKSAKTNYRGMFVDAEELVIDRRDFLLEATGSEEHPVRIHFGAGKIKEFQRVKIDLRNLKILDCSPRDSE